MSNHDSMSERLAHASEAEREQIVQELRQRAATSGDPDDVNQLALAYVHLRKFRPAAELWEQLLHATGSSPEADVYRMSLATTYDDLGFSALSHHHFGYLAERGTTDELRQIGTEQLERLDEEEADRRVEAEIRRQRFALALQRAESVGDLVDLETLGSLLPEIIHAEPSLDRINRVRHLLEAGEQKYPYSAEVMLGLLFATDELGDRRTYDRVKGRLEALVDSGAAISLSSDPVAMAARVARGTPAEAASHLFGLLQSGGPDVAAAAAEDLERLTKSNPRDTSALFAYAWMLRIQGRQAELRAELERIAALEEPTHHYHFNAGQLLMLAGDIERGRRSLRLSLELARTEEDIADAREILGSFGINAS
jgi:hypothetical protein